MPQDRRYDLTGAGSEGDPQLGTMSTQQPFNPVVPLPPTTNGTDGGKPTFNPSQDARAQNVMDPNMATRGSLFQGQQMPTEVVPTESQEQLDKLTKT